MLPNPKWTNDQARRIYRYDRTQKIFYDLKEEKKLWLKEKEEASLLNFNYLIDVSAAKHFISPSIKMEESFTFCGFIFAGT